MEKVSNVFATNNVNGLPYYVRKDERACVYIEDWQIQMYGGAERAAIICLFNIFLSAETPNGWRH
jgi:hypothetical protein